MMKLLLPLVCLLGPGFASPVDSPDRHMVLSVVATTQDQVDLLKSAEDSDYELDFWTHPRLNGYTDVMVPWKHYNELRRKWTGAGMQVDVKQEDVETLIQTVEEENRRLRAQRHLLPRAGARLSHSYYRSYDEIVEAFDELVENYPSLVRKGDSSNLPQTVEERTIEYFEVGSDDAAADVIFLEVMIHAREWIVGAGNLYAFDWLVTNYGTNNNATFLLDNFRFVIMPAANPDGYEWSRIPGSNTTYRLWRKNRQHIGGSCYGVDLNRNFDVFWLGSGSCTSSTYPGPSAESEAETKAVVQLFREYKDKAVAYLAVHAYSQVMLVPWSYKNSNSNRDPNHKALGEAMADAMSKVHNRNFTAGTPRETLGYGAAGTSCDWALVEMEGETYDEDADTGFMSLAYELRPAAGSGFGGFILSPTEIIPAGQEYLASLVALGKELEEGRRRRR